MIINDVEYLFNVCSFLDIPSSFKSVEKTLVQLIKVNN